MPKPDFKPELIYSIVIDAPAAKVWNALTDGEHTPHFWAGFKVSSDWTEGALIEFRDPSGKVIHDGHVMHIDPPNTLTMTMKIDPDPPSIVTYELSDFFGAAKLTVLHGQFNSAEEIEQTRNGWSEILSLMKTYLERGAPMDAANKWRASRDF